MREINQSALKRSEFSFMRDDYDTLRDAFVQRYKDCYKKEKTQSDPVELQLQFAADMFELISTDNDTSKITVVPAQCGIGKSAFVLALIHFFVINDAYFPRDEDMQGAIIVTDLLDRLQSYLSEPQFIESIWGEMGGEGRRKHSEYCAYIGSDSKETVKTMFTNAAYKPIVLITTQRYFGLNEVQRNQLFSYINYKNEKRRRDIVVFDERPYFYKSTTIDVRNFNDCDTAIRKGLPKDGVVKDQILEAWEPFRDKMLAELRNSEMGSANKEYFFWNPKDEEWSIHFNNTDENYRVLATYRNKITSHHEGAFRDFELFEKMQNEGAFFITKRDVLPSGESNYTSYFHFFEDNRDKFYLGQDVAKFFVFDATASIDPDYACDYVKMIDCKKYSRPIKSKINLINVNTSKSHLINNNTKDRHKHIATIVKDIEKRQKIGFDKMLIITYKSIVDYFNIRKCDIAYFGNIKGRNDFSQLRRMAHVGTNRYDGFEYFLRFLVRKPDKFTSLKQLSKEQSKLLIELYLKQQMGVFADKEIAEIMNRSIVVDIVQNIFRTAIRNYDNEDEVTVFSYWNANTYKGVNSILQEYFFQYGVDFEFTDTPSEFNKTKTMNRKSSTKQPTRAQVYITWIDNQTPGEVFKLSTMLTETNTTNKQFQDTKRDNSYLAEFFSQYYEKKGYYKIPEK